MTTYRVAQATTAGAPLEIAEREVRRPGPGHVRIDVEACGVCHSDSYFIDGALPGVRFPVVGGHEIGGRIAEIGDEVPDIWNVGDRVAVGWFGGSCMRCEPCRRGDFIVCENLKVPGWSYEGGFADKVIVPADALALIPDELSAAEAGVMGCAGVTTFNALRQSRARSGERVAVLGVGGLGHLGVQFAAAMGFETIAIARGEEKADFARELGAHHYIDSTADKSVADTLRALGGASVVLATAANSEAIGATVDGLRPRGELLVIGIDNAPLGITPGQLILTARTVHGHPSGTAKDIEDTLAFSVLHSVRPIIETMPLQDAASAYQKMLDGKARFRVVLTTD